MATISYPIVANVRFVAVGQPGPPGPPGKFVPPSGGSLGDSLVIVGFNPDGSPILGWQHPAPVNDVTAVDNGDGTASFSGTAVVVTDDTYTISSTLVVDNGDGTYSLLGSGSEPTQDMTVVDNLDGSISITGTTVSAINDIISATSNSVTDNGDGTYTYVTA